MANGITNRGYGSSSTILFVSIVATVFVAERLWQMNHEIRTLKSELHNQHLYRSQIHRTLIEIGITDMKNLTDIPQKYKICSKSEPSQPSQEEKEFMFVDVHPQTIENVPGVNTDIKLDDRGIITVGVSEDDKDMPPILGQVDIIEDGMITGWACEKGKSHTAHDVRFFVNGVYVGEASTSGSGAHGLVNRICDGPANIGTDDKQSTNIAFTFRLPILKEGVYELKAFVYGPDGVWRKELNSSPQKFVETSRQPGLSDAIKRKDAIIRARNAQVASLYEQLHTRGIWARVTNFKPVLNLTREQEDSEYLAFVGIFSKPTERHSRDLQRNVWFPKGDDIEKIAKEKGIILRFVIGKSDWMTEDEMAALRGEIKDHNDILVVDERGFEDPAKKTLAFYKAVAFDYSVDFIFRLDKDVVVDLDELREYLLPKRKRGNLYMGCMKSGEVVRSARQKWHEPEHWKFGEGQGKDRTANYPRHAERQFLGVSHLVAKYLAQNAEVMHFYANDDVSVGVWLLGLEIEYLNERRFCCSPLRCMQQPADQRCLGYFDSGCAGLCQPETRIAATYRSCIVNKNFDDIN